MPEPGEVATQGVGCLLREVADPQERALAFAIRDLVIRMRPQQLLVPRLEGNTDDLMSRCLQARQEGACVLARCINYKMTVE